MGESSKVIPKRDYKTPDNDKGCPVCHKPLDLPVRAWLNADNYSQAVVVKTLCCGELVNLFPIRRYRVFPNTDPNRKEDDWGEPREKLKLKIKTDETP